MHRDDRGVGTGDASAEAPFAALTSHLYSLLRVFVVSRILVYAVLGDSQVSVTVSNMSHPDNSLTT